MRSALALLFLSISAILSTAQTALDGSGSTFVSPIMARSVTENEKAHRDLQISYSRMAAAPEWPRSQRLVDFGATDAPLTNDQLSKAEIKVIHVPVIIGADVPAYNLKSVKTDLRFTPQILAGIFWEESRGGTTLLLRQRIRVSISPTS